MDDSQEVALLMIIKHQSRGKSTLVSSEIF